MTSLQLFSVPPTPDGCWSCRAPLNEKQWGEPLAHEGGERHPLHKSCWKQVITPAQPYCTYPGCIGRVKIDTNSLYSWKERLVDRVQNFAFHALVSGATAAASIGLGSLVGLSPTISLIGSCLGIARGIPFLCQSVRAGMNYIQRAAYLECSYMLAGLIAAYTGRETPIEAICGIRLTSALVTTLCISKIQPVASRFFRALIGAAGRDRDLLALLSHTFTNWQLESHLRHSALTFGALSYQAAMYLASLLSFTPFQQERRVFIALSLGANVALPAAIVTGNISLVALAAFVTTVAAQHMRPDSGDAVLMNRAIDFAEQNALRAVTCGAVVFPGIVAGKLIDFHNGSNRAVTAGLYSAGVHALLCNVGASGWLSSAVIASLTAGGLSLLERKKIYPMTLKEMADTLNAFIQREHPRLQQA